MSSWLRLQPYWIPLAFAIVFGLVGRSTYLAAEASARAEVEAKLETILDANIAALDIWLVSQSAVAQDLAADKDLQSALSRLEEEFRQQGMAGLVATSAGHELNEIVEPVQIRHGYLGWRLYDRDMVCVAGSDPKALGRRGAVSADQIERLRNGETLVTPPLVVEAEDLIAAPRGVMAIFTPVKALDGGMGGGLAVGINAATTFSRLLEVARMGETGETYAFSREGRLLSQSRFEPLLRRIGLLPDDPDVGSFMNIEIRDPGGDLAAGYVSPLPLLARPLTRMAAAAVSGESGIDLDGYRDYRGMIVVGAWRWLPALQLGIASEMDRDEAYGALAPMRAQNIGLLLLLGLAALGMLVYSIVIRRMQGDLAVARRFGRYRIEALIGRGGMGSVYRARHALLRRPTAIKVLRPEHTNAETIARFEREVQVTSQLTHPNTIEIYDFGETPDGLFYYAMEYVDGATLREIVDATGRLPEARALEVLRALCGSLAEAHRIGMIHRDIKPSNVMLCERGGLYDFVKVVDFGLVKPLTGRPEDALTDVRSLTGTPLYMPPEVIESPDAVGPRSDVYQIGAVGYFLITGRHVFEGERVVEVLEKHLNAEPRRPSDVLGSAIDEALEELLLRCLAKDPAHRPADAGALLLELQQIEIAPPWTQSDAARFFEKWQNRPVQIEATEGDSAPVRAGDSLVMGRRPGDDEGL